MDKFAREHDRRAHIYHAIADLLEALEIPTKHIVKITDVIQKKEFKHRKEVRCKESDS
jgi:hypothetical protein